MRARHDQLAPDWPFFIWLILSGRGWGKTKTGGEWVVQKAEENPGCWIAVISETPAKARDDMVEGPSGILNAERYKLDPSKKPDYEPSKRRITWPNGSWATIYSGAHPEQIRGFSGSFAWLDELMAWQYPQEAFDMLLFGLREGRLPQLCITTTPKPLPLLRTILEEWTEMTQLTTGSSFDNRDNLAGAFYKTVVEAYVGTTLGRQEIFGEILWEVEGAYWTMELLERTRRKAWPRLKQIVVAVDPQAKKKDGGSETGIIVAGIDTKRRAEGYVLEDRSKNYSPKEWAQEAIDAYHEWGADSVVCETNQGGDMVKETIWSIDPNIPIREVNASVAKIARAEPVAALYEQDRIHHVGTFGMLETQMVTFIGEKDPNYGSPDRLDAMVWAFHALFRLKQRPSKLQPPSTSQKSLAA